MGRNLATPELGRAARVPATGPALVLPTRAPGEAPGVVPGELVDAQAIDRDESADPGVGTVVIVGGAAGRRRWPLGRFGRVGLSAGPSDVWPRLTV